MPEPVEDCVDSVLEDNPDYDESRAYAICKAQHEANVDAPPEIVRLSDTNIPAEGLDQLADERPNEWGRFESERGVAWVGLSTGATVYTSKESESETAGQQQDNDFSVDVLEVRQDGDDGPGTAGDLLGMGVDFPESDVYVDWNIEAWPDDQRLSDAHVSIYSTVQDLRGATGNSVEVVDSIGAMEAQAMIGEAFEGISQQFDPMAGPHQYDPGEERVHCEESDEEWQAATWSELEGDCPHCGGPLLAVDQDAWADGTTAAVETQQQDRGGYEYPEAGPEDAPPEVQDAVERFREDVPDEVKADTPLLYWLLAESTPAYKMAKQDADYQAEPNAEERCANCEYFYTGADGESICAQVAGGIEPEAWCRLYERVDDVEAEGETVTLRGLSQEGLAFMRERFSVDVIGGER